MRSLASPGAAVLACLALPVLSAPAALAQGEAPETPRVERVEIQNNQYLQVETLLFYVSTKAGDRYDETRLKDDFRRLWGTGFLDDLILDVRDSPAGKVVAFRVVERKRIQIVDVLDVRGGEGLAAGVEMRCSRPRAAS